MAAVVPRSGFFLGSYVALGGRCRTRREPGGQNTRRSSDLVDVRIWPFALLRCAERLFRYWGNNGH
jgi:hypothetical protein